MSWLLPSIIATFIGTLLLICCYYYLYRIHRTSYLLYWTIGWVFYAMRYLFAILFELNPSLIIFSIFNLEVTLISGIFLFTGTALFAKKKIYARSLFFITSLVGFYVVLSRVYAFSFWVSTVPVYSFLAVIYCWTGIQFLSKRNKEYGEYIFLGVSFILWGIHKANYPFLRQVSWFAPWGYLLGVVFILFTAFGFIVLHVKEAKIFLVNSQRFLDQSLKKATIPILAVPFAKEGDLFLNESYIDSFGLHNQEQILSWLQDALKSNYSLGFFADPLKILAKKHKAEQEWILNNQQDQTRIYRVKIVILEDYLLLFFNDITEIRTQSITKEDCEEILDFMDQGVVFMDDRQIILHVNRYLFKLLEEADKEWLGRKWDDSLLQDLPADSSWEIIKLQEMVHKNKPGSRGQYIILKNRYRDKQLSSYEQIGKFTTHIAHELNNSMSPIVGYSDLLRNDNQISDELREILERIYKAGEKSVSIVNRLLAYSKKQLMDMKPDHINALVLDEISYLKTMCNDHIQISTNLDSNLPPIVIDSRQISEVLRQIFYNSKEAMPRGGAFIIETRECYIDDEFIKHHPGAVKGHYICVECIDDGIGIAPSEMPHIFEPFFSSKGPEHTGFGLSSAQGILGQHDGYIWVDSIHHKGTRVMFYLPKNDNL